MALAHRCVRRLRCTGARQVVTGLNELQRRNGKVGLKGYANDTAQAN